MKDEMSKEELKKACTEFFYYCFSVEGYNTGFDSWLETKEGQDALANCVTPTKAQLADTKVNLKSL